MMERTFCHLCGTKLNTVEGEPKHWQCPGCGQTIYDNPRPATSIVIFNEAGELLLATRANEPHKGKQDLPGGFVDIGETILEGALRELKEELGLRPEDYSAPEYLGSATDIYPWQREQLPTVVTGFLVRLKPGVKIQANDDVAKTTFVDITTVTQAGIAWKCDFAFIEMIQKRVG